MFKQYLIPINDENHFYYHNMKEYLSTLSISLIGAMIYSVIDRPENGNNPPNWFLFLLIIIVSLWMVKKSFAKKPTVVLIKPSSYKHRIFLARVFSYLTLIFIGVTCSALYSMMTSSIENESGVFIKFSISYCVFFVCMFLSSYFSINNFLEKNKKQ